MSDEKSILQIPLHSISKYGRLESLDEFLCAMDTCDELYRGLDFDKLSAPPPWGWTDSDEIHHCLGCHAPLKAGGPICIGCLGWMRMPPL